jgi:hypothetical protein
LIFCMNFFYFKVRPTSNFFRPSPLYESTNHRSDCMLHTRDARCGTTAAIYPELFGSIMMANILTTMLYASGTRGHLDVIVSLFGGNGNVIIDGYSIFLRTKHIFGPDHCDFVPIY